LNKTSLVVTTVSSPNEVLNILALGALKHRWTFFCVGDAKSPSDFDLKGCEFVSLTQQFDSSEFSLTQHLPANHYARKNYGYLKAMVAGSEYIVETDDDNMPLDSFWQPREVKLQTEMLGGSKWINIYKVFSDENIWPRGFPLSRVLEKTEYTSSRISKECPVQQSLINGDTDVDAIYRLVMNHNVIFDERDPVILDKGSWSPFNSQNTSWHRSAFKLLYLPSYCSSRMTDIWRSFIVQACLWASDYHLSFHPASVCQDRNSHDFLKDFEDEIPGYLNNELIADQLRGLPLRSGEENVFTNLVLCYEKLISLGSIDAKEEVLIEAWISDLTRIGI